MKYGHLRKTEIIYGEEKSIGFLFIHKIDCISSHCTLIIAYFVPVSVDGGVTQVLKLQVMWSMSDAIKCLLLLLIIIS